VLPSSSCAPFLPKLTDPRSFASLDVPLDLSKVLFVCTANEISHLSAPLRDRMEMMEVSGYVTEEKMAIARDYLIPQVAKGTGLEKVDVTVEEEALKSMIEDYARETGVRSLKKLLDRVSQLVLSMRCSKAKS
jgi:Lon-like ATP-dependent protease